MHFEAQIQCEVVMLPLLGVKQFHLSNCLVNEIYEIADSLCVKVVSIVGLVGVE
jgi:hypothetical protein